MIRVTIAFPGPDNRSIRILVVGEPVGPNIIPIDNGCVSAPKVYM